MQFNLFAWIREGVKRSVILGVNDAVEAIGAPHDDPEWKDRLSRLLAPATVGTLEPSATDGKRRRLGRSLKDFTAES